MWKMAKLSEVFLWDLSGVSPKTEQNVRGARAWRLGGDYGPGHEGTDRVVGQRGDDSSDAKPHAQHAGGAGLSRRQDWGPS